MSSADRKRRTRFVSYLTPGTLPSILEGPSPQAASTTKTLPAATIVKKETEPIQKPKRVFSGNSENHAREPLNVDGMSYQEHYRVCFYLTLGRNRDVTAAQKKAVTSRKEPQGALLWNVSGPNARDEVAVVQSIRHDNFVRALAVYGAGNDLTVAFEFVPLSLSEVVVNRGLYESELACILKQVVNGLSYLEQRNLGHPKLTCSNVLIDHGGNVKIWGQQHCCQRPSDNLSIGICFLTAQLLSGCEEVDPDELSYGDWMQFVQVVDFFELTKQLKNTTRDILAGSVANSTTTRNPMERLSRHTFLTKAGEPHSLEMLLHLVRYTTRWPVRCSEVTGMD